jgi:hypothetical protein
MIQPADAGGRSTGREFDSETDYVFLPRQMLRSAGFPAYLAKTLYHWEFLQLCRWRGEWHV